MSSEKREQKSALYALFAQVGKALANPHRLELLDLLVQAPRTVEELAAEAGMSVANTSQHLQRLKQARLVASDKEGLYVRYAIADAAVVRLWLELRAVAERQLAEVQRALDAYRDRRHEFEQVSAAELRERLEAGDVILLDVRPAKEYAAGHLPSARSLPWNEVKQHLAELTDGASVVAYCRGPYCLYADEALGILADRGWRVARLEEGVAEWQQAGYPIE
jgi:rhodanese-related sulfurtransferase/predicted transcriptional regulator